MAYNNEDSKMDIQINDKKTLRALETYQIPQIVQVDMISNFLDERIEFMDEEEIFEIGREARNLRDFSNIVIGRLALALQTRYGEDSIRTFAEQIGLKAGTVAQYRWVAKAFPLLKSYDGLSFSYYRIAAGTNSPQEWIDKTVENNWNVTQLEKKIKGKKLASECEHAVQKTVKITRCDDCGVITKREIV